MVNAPALLTSLLISVNCLGQSKLGIENYHYLGQPGASIIVPMIHFETKDNWYAALRYNYEDAETISFFGGKSFGFGNAFKFSLTPMAGLSTGKFNGATIATNVDLDWRDFYGSSQSQYSKGFSSDMTNFFFSWSEIGYNIQRHFFTGVAMQYTRKLGLDDFEPGVLAGINYRNFSFPFYVFSPFRPGAYCVLGLNYEYKW